MRAMQQAQRETWLKNCALDYVFYGGRGFPSDHADEISVDAFDDYAHVFEKAKKVFAIALACGYDYVFHAFLDTYVSIPRLLDAQLLFDKDFVGHRTCGGATAHFVTIEFNHLGRAEYASGGCGCLLSARALRAILAGKFDDPYDDLAIGTILARAEIALYHDPRFQKHGAYLKPGSISTHLSRGTGNYDARQMYDCHQLSL